MKNYPASGISPAFVGYTAQIFKNLRKLLTENGCTNIQLTRSYYYWSGFFTDADGQIWYIASRDWRDAAERTYSYMRTAKSYSDFVGGPNLWVKNIYDIPATITNHEKDIQAK
jgi:hypothetical protein